MKQFSFLHLSDLHFASSKIEFGDVFSKAILGKLNFFLHRKRDLDVRSFTELFCLLQKKRVEAILVSGDLSTTGEEEEFREASRWLEKLSGGKIPVLAVPGNHDLYTQKGAKKEGFDRYFLRGWGSSFTKGRRVFSYLLATIEGGVSWWVIGVNAATPTSWISSQGVFDKNLEQELEDLYQEIPREDQVILMNHFPFLPQKPYRKTLLGGSRLENWLRYKKNIQIYLHGHRHLPEVVDLRSQGLPLVMDCGSSAEKGVGGALLVTIDKNGAVVEFSSSCGGEVPLWCRTFQWI